VQPNFCNFNFVVLHVEGDIRGMQEIVGKIFLDQIAHVAKADDEIVHAVGGVDFYDVPPNRLATDFYHELGADRSFLADSRTQATC
jgi:hypothetical protein